MQLLGLSVLGAVLVIAVSLLLTPTPIDVTEEASGTNASATFPQNPAPIEVEAMQGELRELANKVIEKYPQDFAAYHVAAQVYAELKQSQQAETLWKKCLELSPNQLGASIGLAEVYMASGKDEEALELLERVRDLPSAQQSLEMLLALGKVHENLGQLDDSLLAYRACTELFPQLGSGWLALGRVQNQLGKFEEAESSLRKSIALDGPNEANLFALTTSLVRQRRTDEATELREQVAATQQSANSEDAGFQSQYENALRNIAANIYVSAAIIEEEQGDLLEAANLNRRAIEIDPLQLRAYMSLSSVYRKAKQFADAVVIQRRLLELQPDNLLNYLNLANVEMAAGDVQSAEATLLMAAKMNEQGTLAQSALARLYLASGRTQQAHAMAVQVVENQPVAASYELLAAIYEAAGDFENANAATEKAVELRTHEGTP